MRTRSLAAVLFVCALAGACTTVTEQSESIATDELARKLDAMGFQPAPDASWPGPELSDGDTAAFYVHADTRLAALVHDAVGIEKIAVVLDASGEVAETLSPTDEDSPYVLIDASFFYCQLGAIACYGSCMTACLSDPESPPGCHQDCGGACRWWYNDCLNGY